MASAHTLTRSALAAALLLSMTACMQQTDQADAGTSVAPAAAGSASEPSARLVGATPRGLAAAALRHLDESSIAMAGTVRNRDEGWMAVSAEVQAAKGTVPLDVMVMKDDRSGESADEEFECSVDGKWVLSCVLDQAEDGTPLGVWVSTEDIVGGISRDGCFVFVGNFRDGEIVLVMLTLESRDPSYLDFSGLPVPLETLETIATDPYVGLRTTKELNTAGKDLPYLVPQS